VGGPLGRPSVRPGLSSPFSLRLRRGPALGIIPHSSRQRPGNVKKRWGRPSKESAGQALNSDIVAGGGIGPANSLKVETRVRTPLGLHRKAQVEALSRLNDDSPLPFVLHLSRGRRRHVTSDPPNHGPPRRRGRSPPSPSMSTSASPTCVSGESRTMSVDMACSTILDAEIARPRAFRIARPSPTRDVAGCRSAQPAAIRRSAAHPSRGGAGGG
jgi:hypothetical protein